MAEIKTYSLTKLFKTSWEELYAFEHIHVLALSDKLHTIEDKSGEEYGLLIIAMLRILRKNKRIVSNINVEQAVDCFNDISFFKRNDKGEFITPWLFFPVLDFWVGGSSFVRPKMNGPLPMYNRVFDQLVYADTAFSNFCVMHHHENPNFKKDIDDALNAMVAVLYQNPLTFDINQLEIKAEQIRKKLSLNDKALILHTYANVRRFITDRCPNLFPKKPDEDQTSPSQQTGPMWLNLRYDLAETEVFKGFDAARNALMYDALDYLDKKMSERPKPTPHA